MATVLKPITAVQQEIRCDSLICRNALDVPESDPLNKYAVIIDRVAEPQDADGKQVGERIRLPSATIPLAVLVQETYTVDEITLSGAQILAFVNAAVDAHKADGI